jgi:hypothetical protein
VGVLPAGVSEAVDETGPGGGARSLPTLNGTVRQLFAQGPRHALASRGFRQGGAILLRVSVLLDVLGTGP